MENVGGIFVVLLGGLSLAVIVALLEFMWNARKNSAIDKVSCHVHGAVGRFSSRLSYNTVIVALLIFTVHAKIKFSYLRYKMKPNGFCRWKGFPVEC